MVSNTPRRDLKTFESGEEWDHTDTVQLVEEDSIDKGPIADRPNSGTYDDELFYAVDQNILWGWDESANDWTIRGGTGSQSQPLDSVHAESASVTNAPTSNTDVARKTETDAVQSNLDSHENDTTNPHNVDNNDVGVTSGTNASGNYEITIDGDTYEFVQE